MTNEAKEGTYLFECLVCEHEFAIQKYGDGACPKCGQKYPYDEGHSIKLNDEQLEALQVLRVNKAAASLLLCDHEKHAVPFFFGDILSVGGDPPSHTVQWCRRCGALYSNHGKDDTYDWRSPNNDARGDEEAD